MATTRAQAAFARGLWSLAWLITFVLFLVKLLSQSTLSWWWVTAPLWGLFGLGLALRVVGYALLGLARLFETEEQKSRRRLLEALEEFARG